MPTVSIIILTYNRKAFLLEALDSIFRQSYTDYEIILIDDGSTDGTQQALEGLKDKPIRYYYTEHLGNLSQLRNLGWQYAKGTYIAFLDADDRWLPEKLAKQVSLMEADQSLGLVFTDVTEFRKQGVVRPRIYAHLEDAWDQSRQFEWTLSGRMPIYASSVLLRKALAEEVGHFEDTLILGDTHYFLRLVKRFPSTVLFAPLVNIRKHDGNISVYQEREAYIEMLAVLVFFAKKEEIDTQMYRKYQAFYYFQLSRFWRRKGRWMAAMWAFLQGGKAKVLGVGWMA